MFLGNFTYSVGAKGRISIPAVFKDALKPDANNTFILIRGIEKCIDVYSLDYWESKIKPRIDELDEWDPEQSAFLRILLELATQQQLDKQLRIFIPKGLLDFAEIKDQVHILGKVNKIELWSPEIFNKEVREYPTPYKELAKQVFSNTKK
jgi:MraZ protein